MTASDLPARKRSGLRRACARLGVMVLAIYLGWCGVLYGLQERMIFLRDLAGAPMPEATIPRNVERIWITAADGSRVEAWFIPAPGAGPGVRSPVAVVTHGNGELIDHLRGYAGEWNARGFGVLLPEYRGYGRSGGRPCEKSIVADMVAFHDLLAARSDVDAARMVYHGRSLGSAVVAQLATHRPPAGLILESPFTSIAAMARRYMVPGFLLTSPFRTDRVLARLGRPVLILHSRDDEIIPFDHGRRLHALTPGSVLVELTGSHNSALGELGAYWSSIDHFLAAGGIVGGPGEP